MPTERPSPPPFEAEWLNRSLDRYLAIGLVAMAVLIAGFVAYQVREPALRSDALAAQELSYRSVGKDLYATNCASCHGKGGNGGGAPTLNAKEFLTSTDNSQIDNLVGVGISGTDMPAWNLDYGGTLTTEQIRQITTYLRAKEATAPSVPDWRHGSS